MEHNEFERAKIWEQEIMIPTYAVGKPDKNPMFLEKRVYQGSSGKVYPLPVIDKIYDKKHDAPYKAVFLENKYLKIMVLPQLGGRIQRAYDKTNGYDFIYYNEVIKPALVGLAGPWISGGIEFNWPQHHRPTTFAPVDYLLAENSDGSASIRMSEVDQMYGTKGEIIISLYPDKAYIEIKGQLYNRTNLPQTFLWWANPAVAVNKQTQSVFPPDVHAVFDHGKRDVSSFPIATGVYYKHDYGAGVDISRYKNIPVPTSYMCAHSDYDFVGGYDYGVEAGILHVADHHVSPGKKQWTWGCGDFGQAWDRNLTDRNGPYIELMTGVFTDNQPDFSWLQPFEEKNFTQYFLPYKKAACVKNASRELLLNLEVSQGIAHIVAYPTARYEDAVIRLRCTDGVLFEKRCTISPTELVDEQIPVAVKEAELRLEVFSQDGRLLLAYQPDGKKLEAIPDPMLPARPPETILTNEELYLNGLHIEQYRHATFLPDPYYLEGLKRDPGDARINTAYGILLLRRGQFSESEAYFRKAIERVTLRNPNPCSSEPHYYLGLSLFYQGRFDEAFDAFYKSVWTAAQQEMGFYYLAAIASRRGDYTQALSFIDQSLVKNAHNLKARALRAKLLLTLGRPAEDELRETLNIDPFAYNSRLMLDNLTGEGLTHTLSLMNNRPESFIECAIDLAEAGFRSDAVEVLRLCKAESPMLKYYEAYYTALSGNDASVLLREAASRSSLYCLPNRLEDILVLEQAIRLNPSDAKAPYYLGCLFYDKRQYETAISLWEASSRLDPGFPTVWRNLAQAYYNKRADAAAAKESLQRAYSLDETDARVLLELDQLNKKCGVSIEQRFSFLQDHLPTVFLRDDLTIEYISLLNLLSRHREALDRILKRHFHPWEGGEGKVTAQYTIALTLLGREALVCGEAERAKDFFRRALSFPDNLGEGKLEGAKDNNIYYYLGLAEEMLGNPAAARQYYLKACEGMDEPASSMYYNDQPADMILYQGLAHRKLGNEEHARSRFHKLISYGEKHFHDRVSIEYFAVSLPELQLFDEDLSLRNRIDCFYLMGLGHYGLGDLELASHYLEEVLRLDCAHQGAHIHLGFLHQDIPTCQA